MREDKKQAGFGKRGNTSVEPAERKASATQRLRKRPVVARQRFAEENKSAREGFQAGTVAIVTTGRGAAVRDPGEGEKLLAFWTRVIADWADRMPLRNVYIFRDHGRAEAAPVRKLKIAIEYGENVGADSMRRWQQENSTDFADLDKVGIETELFTDQDYDVWRPIRDAARAPLMTVRKVRVVHIPERAF